MINLLRRLCSPTRQPPVPPTTDAWDLATPLLYWAREDPWTIGHSVAGTFVTGATGSGKSSGSGRALALAMLRAGYGGLVLTAKPDEVGQWTSYCKKAWRLDDLMLIEPGGPWRFNPLDFEANRCGAGAGLCENVVGMFLAVLELADRSGASAGGGGGGGREDEGYWRRALKQLIRNFTQLHMQATGSVSFDGLYRAVISAPTSPEQVNSPAWQQASHCLALLRRADAASKTPAQTRDLELAADYILREYPQLSDKTRSVIVSTFTSMVDVMQRSPLRELFGGKTTFTPKASEEGKVIVLGMSVKEYGEVGLVANAILKHAWQRSIERRDVAHSPRPVFLFADEAQHFLSSGTDMMFATTCRSARVAMVLLTQNISNLYAALGGSEKGRAEANSILANCNLKVAHANGDPVTNEWFAGLSGRSRQLFLNGGTSHSTSDRLGLSLGLPHSGQTSGGFSEQMDFEIQPSAFSRLRTGGKLNAGRVDAVLFQNGGTFNSTGRTWMRVEFEQDAR